MKARIKKHLSQIAREIGREILFGDYKITSVGTHTVTINTFSGIDLELWTSNGQDCFEVYSTTVTSTKTTLDDLGGFLKIKESERSRGWLVLSRKKRAFERDVLLIKKREELERVKAKITEIESDAIL